MKSSSSSAAQNPGYEIVISEATFKKIQEYKQNIIEEEETSGKLLENAIYKNRKSTENQIDFLQRISDSKFVELLLETKQPKLFAESELVSRIGEGKDWSAKEIELLGGVSISVPAKALDNGKYNSPEKHEYPMDIQLVFTPGPLLVNIDSKRWSN